MSQRLAQLQKMLEKTPGDPFLLYAAGLEAKKQDDLATALGFLARTIEADADYMYAYYQQGQILEQKGDTEAAKVAYDTGLKRARAKGDTKAAGELQQARELLD